MTNELTDVRCPCGTEFPAESYDAGFIAGSGMCQNCDAALPPKDICTCPSGDGSLRHPCPAHPAPVEQAGGDERAAFRPAQVISYRPGVGEVTIYVAGRVPGYMNIGDTVYVSDRAPVEQPIAALAQPSPAQAEQAEPERPEVVAVVRAQGFGRVCEADANTLYQHCSDGDELMTVAQHDRIVGELRADRDSWAEQAEQRLADWDEMRKERDAALARVAELERQEPVALANRGLHAFWVKWTEAAAGLYGPGIKLYAAPVAQAQHSVPELDQLYSMLGAESQVDAAKKIAELVGCRMSRSALTEAQMRRLYENSTEAENERLGFAAFARLMRRAEAVHQLAAAPGKEGA